METGVISYKQQHFKSAFIIKFGAYSVPALFCSDKTETGGSVWMVPALDLALRWWMGGYR